MGETAMGPSTPLRVGDRLEESEGYAFCGGYFGRDSYEAKRVEAVGADWVVARDDSGMVWFAVVNPERLIEYRSENGSLDET